MPDWVAVVDQDSSKVYYYSPKTRATRWLKPENDSIHFSPEAKSVLQSVPTSPQLSSLDNLPISPSPPASALQSHDIVKKIVSALPSSKKLLSHLNTAIDLTDSLSIAALRDFAHSLCQSSSIVFSSGCSFSSLSTECMSAFISLFLSLFSALLSSKPPSILSSTEIIAEFGGPVNFLAEHEQQHFNNVTLTEISNFLFKNLENLSINLLFQLFWVDDADDQPTSSFTSPLILSPVDFSSSSLFRRLIGIVIDSHGTDCFDSISNMLVFLSEAIDGSFSSSYFIDFSTALAKLIVNECTEACPIGVQSSEILNIFVELFESRSMSSLCIAVCTELLKYLNTSYSDTNLSSSFLSSPMRSPAPFSPQVTLSPRQPALFDAKFHCFVVMISQTFNRGLNYLNNLYILSKSERSLLNQQFHHVPLSRIREVHIRLILYWVNPFCHFSSWYFSKNYF
ncbi:hypothetical protein GEMRC1_001454 [Eukaryota sp. GEM-RC1]